MTSGEPTPSESPYTGLATRIRPEGSSDAQALAAQKLAREPILRIALTPVTVLLRPLIEPCWVFLDGQSIGKLASGQKLEATLVAGSHQVQVVCGRLRSNVVELKVENGDIAQFVCTGHHSGLDLIFGPALFFALLRPNKFFRLRSFRP